MVLVLRILLGSIFVASGAFKFYSAEAYRDAILWILDPGFWAMVFAIAVPVLEILIGVMLLIDYHIQRATIISVCGLAAFTVSSVYLGDRNV